MPSTDVHTRLETDIAQFLGIDSVIVYSQSFSTITSVIPAFAKRGDVVVADKSVNFAIQKGLQIARCTVKWYEHNDMADLERQLKIVEKEARRKGGPLKRRFIVTEGIFENNGAMLDLAKVVRQRTSHLVSKEACTDRYCIGRAQEEIQVPSHAGRDLFVWHGGQTWKRSDRSLRGASEQLDRKIRLIATVDVDSVLPLQATEVDILVGSMAVGLNAGGGFCAGMEHVTHHQASRLLRSRLLKASADALHHCSVSTEQLLSFQPLCRDYWRLQHLLPSTLCKLRPKFSVNWQKTSVHSDKGWRNSRALPFTFPRTISPH